MSVYCGDVGDVGKNSIYDRIKEDENKDLFTNAMRRGVRRDSMYSFSKSISQNRKENEQGKLPYWDGETALEWLRYYNDNSLKFSKHKIWISKSHQTKYFDTYVTITADEIRQAHAEGLITDDMLTNVWCPTLKQKMKLYMEVDSNQTQNLKSITLMMLKVILVFQQVLILF